MQASKEEITNFFQILQDNICLGLETADGNSKFHEDLWERPEGGGGRTRIIQGGDVIEKGGVNFSAVSGELPGNIITALKLNTPNKQFYATGVSIVIHPINPWVPIIHMNVRYFEVGNDIWWFGGGIDLTPHYIIESDAHFFHTQLKKACDKTDNNYYPKFKKWADDYFFIKHRQETRGIGGIFFDRLGKNEQHSKAALFEFVKNVGNSFLPIYTELITRNKNKSYTEQEQQWQKIRRGRYVEFNLVYDKGTKFGLDTNGRIESILMSLPKDASWHYNFQVTPESEEDKTLKLLIKGKDWG